MLYVLVLPDGSLDLDEWCQALEVVIFCSSWYVFSLGGRFLVLSFVHFLYHYLISEGV